MYIRNAFHQSIADSVSHAGVTYKGKDGVFLAKRHVAKKAEEQARVRCNDTLNGYSELLLIHSLERRKKA